MSVDRDYECGCGAEGVWRDDLEEVLCDLCYRDECEAIDADRVLHGQRDEGRL